MDTFPVEKRTHTVRKYTLSKDIVLEHNTSSKLCPVRLFVSDGLTLNAIPLTMQQAGLIRDGIDQLMNDLCAEEL